MSRLYTQDIASAGGQAAQLFGVIKAAVGKVPNAYAGVGSNSPVALEAVLNLDSALRKSSLKGRQVEAIKLAVSEVAGCDYCLAAHTLMAKAAGLSADAVRSLRRAEASGDAQLDALTTFVHTLVTTQGTVPATTVDAVRAAGFSDAQIVDTLLAVAAITFTNLFNRVNDTVLDFPAAD
ncbi:carboxymuconolactone decarboxylase family protein [Herbaspirillum sp. RV1423]|uniref:carboxymuconolactone decarboxylase family protein n=1 Tax=Herbaspirillum sp. RV1423 TaxID=1443993 RepID=UPI0004BC0982|nr:carboxymuconolactone decarboxylase family protein [Herbaspirillum sp. RV1423]